MAVAGQWRVEGGKELAALLTKGAAQTPALMAVVVKKTAVDLVGLTQRNASGRPGPNAPTGDYRGSWGVEDVNEGPGAVARSAGTDRAQARRLEYGFVGTDSMGRTYDQQPYPHMGPAVDTIEPIFHAAMAKAAEQAVRW